MWWTNIKNSRKSQEKGKHSSHFESHTILHCVVWSLSRVWLSLWPHGLPGSPSMGFPRREYWSGVPFPSPGDFPDPRLEPASPALHAGSLPLSHQGSPQFTHWRQYISYLVQISNDFSEGLTFPTTSWASLELTISEADSVLKLPVCVFYPCLKF